MGAREGRPGNYLGTVLKPSGSPGALAHGLELGHEPCPFLVFHCLFPGNPLASVDTSLGWATPSPAPCSVLPFPTLPASNRTVDSVLVCVVLSMNGMQGR